MLEQIEAKWMVQINQNIAIWIKFKHWTFWCYQNVTDQMKLIVELGYTCPGGPSQPSQPAVTPGSLNTKKRPAQMDAPF